MINFFFFNIIEKLDDANQAVSRSDRWVTKACDKEKLQLVVCELEMGNLASFFLRAFQKLSHTFLTLSPLPHSHSFEFFMYSVSKLFLSS